MVEEAARRVSRSESENIRVHEPSLSDLGFNEAIVTMIDAVI